MVQSGIPILLEQSVIRLGSHVRASIAAMHGIALEHIDSMDAASPDHYQGVCALTHFFGSIQGFYLLSLSESSVLETFGYDLEDNAQNQEFCEFLREVLNVSSGQALPFLEPAFGSLTYTPAMLVQGRLNLPDYASAHQQLRCPSGQILHCAVYVSLAEVKISAELLRTRKALEETVLEAHSDGLTRLYNRHYFDQTFTELVEASQHRLQICSAIWIDVDYFKSVNDEHGHMAGDQALRHVANAIRKTIRATDLAYRYGGDEFVLLLPGAPSEPALHVSQRIASYLKDSPLELADGNLLIIGLSIGVATLREGDTPERLLLRADQQLYRAKECGRGCVRSDCDGISI